MKYAIAIRFDPRSQTISGTTTITARATQDLSSFYYDLVLQTDSVTIDGAPAEVQQEGSAERRGDPGDHDQVRRDLRGEGDLLGQPGEDRVTARATRGR